jgi:hypothetical protein
MAATQEVSIDGLDETLRNLKKIGVEAVDLKQINFDAGLIVARRVEPPVDSGDLATTLRVAKATNRAKVTYGTKTKGFYSTFISYGTKKLEANPFLLEAKKESLPEIYDHYEKSIDALIAKYNLD